MTTRREALFSLFTGVVAAAALPRFGRTAAKLEPEQKAKALDGQPDEWIITRINGQNVRIPAYR